MADVITRLKLETTQYDSKLRDASKELAAFAREAKTAGTSFQQFAQKNMESARSFGNIATSATNAKDKVKELVNAYNNVAKAYNDLTQEQKQSDFGKAMASSLETLKGRISEAKQEMQGMSSQGKETGGIMEALSSKFTMNIDVLSLFSKGLELAKGALDVVKDAFFNNEQNLDEWGRTVEASESLYKGFLHSLNTGDISGFLNNIDRITKAAREAYDALDELATFNAFNKVNLAKTRAGYQESVADFREGSGSKEDVKKSSEAYIKELEKAKQLQMNAYKKSVAKVAAERGVAAGDLLRVMTGSYGSFNELKNVKMTGSETRFYGTGSFGGGGSYQVAVPSNDRERLAQAVQHLNDTEINTLQSMAEQAQMTEYEIQSQRKAAARIVAGVNKRTGGGGGGGSTTHTTRGGGGGGTAIVKTETQLNNEQIDALAKQYEAASEERRQQIREEIKLLQQRNAEIQRYYDIAIGKQREIVKGDTNVNGLAKPGTASFAGSATDPSKMVLNMQSPLQTMQLQLDALKEAQQQAFTPEQFAAYQVAIDEVQKKMDKFTNTGNTKNMKSSWTDVAGAIQNVGSALQSIENPAVKVMGIIAEAIANIALAFSFASKEEGKKGVWNWIAATAAGLATMVATISAIKSATSGNYAGGGIVPGNSYSGDNMRVYGINSGELILNRAQQGNLASQLTSQNVGRLEAVITGEQLRLVLNNNSRRVGRGEYLTSKFAG